MLCFSNNYTGYGISALKTTVGKSILRGRPFGGVATLVHNKLARLVSCIACCERYVILTINNYLFINMYLPCSSVTGNSIIELLLTEVLNIVKLFPDHTIIVGGDMNISLLDDSIGARIIHKFRNECKLTLCNDVIKLNSEFTYYHDTQKHYSIIDFFMMSSAAIANNEILVHRVIDDLVNLSDHLPIIISLVDNSGLLGDAVNSNISSDDSSNKIKNKSYAGIM